MEKLRIKKYQILIMIVTVIIGIIGINKIGNIDRKSGKINIEKAYVSKVMGSISQANIINNEKIKSYDKIEYEIRYKIDGEEKRNVEIKAKLTEDEKKYALFEEIKSEDKESILNEDKSEITIKINNVEPKKEQTLKLKLVIKGAPDGYRVNPKIEIKEETSKEYEQINVKEAIVYTKSITGVVRDETKNVVSNIELKIENEKREEIKRTYTDEQGRYTFSDLEEGKYYIDIVEDRFEILNEEEIELDESKVLDIKIKKVEPFKIDVKKYINKVIINNNTYTYGEIERVNQSVKNLKSIQGHIEYKIRIKNLGNKEGTITRIEETVSDGLTFKTNNGWKEKNGKIINEELEGINLKPGETKELKLNLLIDKTEEAKAYLQKVTVKGEIYENVSYIVDNNVFKKQEVLEGEKIKDIEMPNKNGMKFSGWYTDKNLTNKYNFDNDVTKDIILYGKYESTEKKYNVIFIDEGNVIEKRQYDEGTIIVKPNDPIKEGYTFKGWYEDLDKEEYDLLLPITKDITLYSKYDINNYKITFKNDDGSILQSDLFPYGKIPEYKGNTPIKGSTDEYLYTFAGWDPKITKVTKDQTYTAIYSKQRKKYTITFIDQGTSTSQTLDYGSVVTKPINPEKEGYTFKGWYEDGNKEATEFPITLTRNITLNSRYDINKYTIKFFDKDTEIKEFEQEVEYKEEAKEPELAPTLEDYKFVGWFIRGTETPYVFGTPVIENIELEAKFTKKEIYTVTFNIEGDITVLEPITVPEGNTGIERPSPDPLKKGYVFDGWYTDSTFNNKYSFNSKIENDIELYGRYIENQHIITYINEDDIWEEERVLDTYIAKGPIKGNPTKDGHTFLYWSLEQNGEEYALNTYEVTSNLTLYAVYNINEYLVEFKNYDGSILQSENLEYGSTPEYKGEMPDRPSDPEYTYIFNGWDKQITEVIGNQEYVATYTEEKNKYQITFINYDGSILQSEELEYGSTPEYKGETPDRPSDQEYTYIFNGWDKQITEVIQNQVYKAEYISNKNQYTVTYMDGNDIYHINIVNYNETATRPENDPSKEYNIFLGWYLDDVLYDFNTQVTGDLVLNAKYDEIPVPTIEHEPTSWTNSNVVVNISTIEGYITEYRLEDDSEYKEYAGSFEVLENTIVRARYKYNETNGRIQTHEITNIDKINPIIKEIQEGTVTSSSIELIVKMQDSESGIKEVKIYNNDNIVDTYTYSENTIEEQIISYEINDLEELTTYKFKIEVTDYAGNISISEEKELTTIEKDIVAKIIGRNNVLNQELIREAIEKAENEKGEELTEEEVKEIQNRYQDERYESLEEAVSSCGKGQCTILIVKNINESVDILQDQDITIDLNGKFISGTRDYTLQNSGKLIINDTSDLPGYIKNDNRVAIKNIQGATLTLGVDEEPQEVSTQKPNIIGKEIGIENNSVLNFYDGRIEGHESAVSGEVTKTPYLYNARLIDGVTKVVTLTKLAESEARINSTYYTNIQDAMGSSEHGEYKENSTTTSNLMSLIKTDKDVNYFFKYDEEGALVNTNKGYANTTANSYIKLDLSNYTKNQILTINAQISSQQNFDIGYVSITNTKEIPSYNNTAGRFIYISGQKTAQDYITTLEAGNIYYIHLGYYKNANTDYGEDTFKINNIVLESQDNTQNYSTPGVYGFKYKDGSYIAANGIVNTIANSYIAVDLTNETQDKTIIVDAAQEYSNSNGNIGYVTITNSQDVPSYNNSNGRIISISSEKQVIVNATLKAGLVNYIHLGYKLDSSNNTSNFKGKFIINSIKYENGTNILDQINQSKTEYTQIDQIPELNKEPDTIELLKTVTLKEPLKIEEIRNVVLDLKGQTLTTTANDYVIKNNGNLRIIDSKYTNDVEKAKLDYENELAKNKLDYETTLEKYDKYKEDTQLLYDTTYTSEVEAAKNKKYTIDNYVKDSLLLQIDARENVDNSIMKDCSGNNNDGVMNNVELKNNAFVFNGINSYANFGIAKNVGLEDNHSITIDILIKYNESQSQKNIVAAWNNDVGGISLGIDDNDIVKQSTDSYDDNTLKSTEKLNDGNLKHIVGIYDFENRQLKLYINGILVKSQTLNSGLTLGNNILTIGSWNGTSQFYQGNLYNVNIYNKVLSEEEIKQNYQVNTARYETLNNYLTSNTSYGEITSNDLENAYKVFDGDKTSIWENTSNNGYIQWEMPEEKTLTSFRVYGSIEESKNPKSIELLASKDGENYVSLSNTVIETIPEEGLKVDIENYDSYKYYKWQFTNDQNVLSISEIELELYNIIHNKFSEIPKNHVINTDNFEYNNLKNETTYSYMEDSNGTLKFTSAYSENIGMITAKEKIIVPEGITYKIKGNIGLWQDYENNSLLGKVYIGISKTNEIDINSFENYVSYDIKSYTEELRDFNITIDKAGEYYFKIILYHTDISELNTVFANLYNLESSLKPELKTATLRDSVLCGNITSTTGDLILNDEGSNLIIDEGILNVNKSGTKSSYAGGIVNYGTLTLNENSSINNEQNFTYAIDNKKTGNILESRGVINVKSISNSIAIRNESINQETLKGLNINISNNNQTYGIYTNKDLTIDSINIAGYGYGILARDASIVNLEENLSISTNTGVFIPENSIATINVNGSTIKGINYGVYLHRNFDSNIYNGIKTSTLTMNSGLIQTTNGTAGIFNYGTVSNINTVNINGGTIKSSGKGIDISIAGKVIMTDGHIESEDNGISGDALFGDISGGDILHKSNYAILSKGNNNSLLTLRNNFKVLQESVGNGISVDGKGIINIQDDVKVLGTNTYGIYVNQGGTINISGNVQIDAYNYGIYNRSKGTINVGEKDENVDTTYPKINSKSYGIYNPLGTINYYDGVIIAQKENGIYGQITDSEEEYDILIKEESQTLENVTLAVPTIQEFGEVARIDDKTYPSIKSAIDSLNDGDEKTIVILKPIKTILPSIILENKSTLLDLSGNTVQNLSKKTSIINNGSLKIIDSTMSDYENQVNGLGLLTSTGGSIVENSGTLEIDGAELSQTTVGEGTIIRNTGEVKITTGKLSKTNKTNNEESSVIENTESGKVQMLGGTIEFKDSNAAIKNTSTREIEIKGGEIIVEGQTGILNSGPGKVLITGGEISSPLIGTPIRNTSTGEIEINGEDVKISAANSNYQGIENSSSGKVIMKKGTIENNYAVGILNSGQNEGESIVIEGGKITTKGQRGAIYTNSKGTISIYGGTIETTGNYKEAGAIQITGSNANSTINIYGGEIISTGHGVKDENSSNSTINIGIQGDTKEDGETLNVSTTNPSIAASNKGIVNEKGTINFYDGVIKASEAIKGSVKNTEEGYDIVLEKNKDGYIETKYLSKLPSAKIKSTEEEYYTIQEAIDAVNKEGETIEILRNITITTNTREIINEKNIVIDMKGYTITSGNNNFLENTGVLKIVDSKRRITKENETEEEIKGLLTSTGGSIVENKGSLEIDGAELSSTTIGEGTIIRNTGELKITTGKLSKTNKTNNDNSSIIENKEPGKIQMLDGIIEYKDKTAAIKNTSTREIEIKGGEIIVEGQTGILNNGSGKVIVTGGEINSPIYGTPIRNASTGEIEINGENVRISAVNYNNSGIENSLAGKVIIRKGTIETNSAAGIINRGQNEGESIVIEGGTIKTTGSNSAIYTNSKGTISIYGGRIETTGNIPSRGTIQIEVGSTQEAPTINVYGGEIISESGHGIKDEYGSSTTINLGIKGDLKEDGETINVSTTNPSIKANKVGIVNQKGTINFYDGVIKASEAIKGSVKNTEEGYDIVLEKNKDGYIETKYLSKLPSARIKSTQEEYYTIQEAIDAVLNEGETIEILRNITITTNTREIINNKNIVIDIKGYTITSGNDNLLENNGVLKIVDSGRIITKEDGTEEEIKGLLTSTGGSIVENSGTLEIDGATLNTTIQTAIKNIEKGILEITSGKITALGNSWYKAIENTSDNRVTVSGGIIEGAYGIYNDSMGEIVVTGGEIIGKYNIYNNSNGKISMSGGNITNTCGTTTYNPCSGIYNNSSGLVEITGGEINAPNVYGIYNNSLGKVNIYKTSLTAKTAIYNSSNAEVNIGGSTDEDGNVHLSQEAPNIISNETDGVILYNTNKGLTNIYSGNLQSTGVRGIGINIRDGIVNVYGGNIINNPPSDYIADSYAVYNLNGTINITGGILTSPDTIITNNTGTINISNVTLENALIGISQTGTGTINVGIKDRVVSQTAPVIKGQNYGIYNTKGIINFYDGMIIGGSNGAIYGVVTEVETGYQIKNETVGDTTQATLMVEGTEERIIVVNGINYPNLQLAINASLDNVETDVVLYTNITLNNNITVPALKNIKLHLNGFTINYGQYDFIGEGNIEIIETNNEESLIGSIVNLVKDTLNISNISKNIVIYEMNDGSYLESNKVYKLYKDGKELNVDENDTLGRYSIGKEEKEMRTIRGRIYLNDLQEGSYEIISSDGKKASFNISEDGKIYGTAKENIIKENRPLVASAVAELIITLQTGIIQGRYLLLFSLITITLVLLLVIKKRKGINQ